MTYLATYTGENFQFAKSIIKNNKIKIVSDSEMFNTLVIESNENLPTVQKIMGSPVWQVEVDRENKTKKQNG